MDTTIEAELPVLQTCAIGTIQNPSELADSDLPALGETIPTINEKNENENDPHPTLSTSKPSSESTVEQSPLTPLSSTQNYTDDSIPLTGDQSLVQDEEIIESDPKDNITVENIDTNSRGIDVSDKETEEIENIDRMNNQNNEVSEKVDNPLEPVTDGEHDKAVAEATMDIAEIQMEDIRPEPTIDDPATDPMNIDAPEKCISSDVEIISSQSQKTLETEAHVNDGLLEENAADLSGDQNNDNVDLSGDNECENINNISNINIQASPSGLEQSPELTEEEFEAEKYVVTHFNIPREKQCNVCEKVLIPKFVAQKQLETIYVCAQDCLDSFKKIHGDNVVEKILRLRSFAIQENNPVESNTEQNEEVIGEPEEMSPESTHKCVQCKKPIDVGNYLSWEATDYCNEGCLITFQKTINKECAKCAAPITENILGKYCVRFGNTVVQFCSTSCLLSYKRTNQFCTFCQADIRTSTKFKPFCSKRCEDACLPEQATKEYATCAVCHQLKPTELKIRENEKGLFCSEPCFVAYKFVNQVDPMKCASCNTYFEPNEDDPVLYINETSIVLCSKDCQKIYSIMNRRIIVCMNCNIKKYDFDMIKVFESGKMTVCCSNTCLQLHFQKCFKLQVETFADPNIKLLEAALKDCNLMLDGSKLEHVVASVNKKPLMPVHQIIITKPRVIPRQRNVGTMCFPNLVSKGISCKPKTINVEVQSETMVNKRVIPIPCPIYVPVPLHMYVEKIPCPFPLPIPFPIPIFIPTNRKSVNGVIKEIQKIKNRVPADPLEAEILMMAEIAAGDKKDESTSESEDENIKADEGMDNSGPFGEDMLTMALKMASDFEEPVDMETEAATESISQPYQENNEIISKSKGRGKKPITPSASMQFQPAMDTEKSDLNMCLKFSFGVNAWKQWAAIKNQELQRTSKTSKLIKADLLQLTADDLNYSLCIFVKEVRKPNGQEYAPDTIYYLCLGIQQYLYENGRIDNIFCDSFYEKFTNTFNEVCQKFIDLYNDSQYIVTRVEEEHLWESKQLGAHSPLVLLNTLMFFNTKHFSLNSVDQHLQLSFSHIMKHWKRNPNHPGNRHVLLRFYPPQSAEGPRKKRLYEQQENHENPIRCPVKLYEFFLSKCPESVKTRNDVFYLQPERSCVPDSPVWYSTIAMEKVYLDKMLNRIKMVKEINIALLSS